MCFGCNELGLYKKDCPNMKEEDNKKLNYKINHAHVAEDDASKKKEKKEIEEYVLYSALSGAVTPGSDTWLIDSGASKHMTGQKEILCKLTEKDSPQKVSIGDDYQYAIKGIGELHTSLIQELP